MQGVAYTKEEESYKTEKPDKIREQLKKEKHAT